MVSLHHKNICEHFSKALLLSSFQKKSWSFETLWSVKCELIRSTESQKARAGRMLLKLLVSDFHITDEKAEGQRCTVRGLGSHRYLLEKLA